MREAPLRRLAAIDEHDQHRRGAVEVRDALLGDEPPDERRVDPPLVWRLVTEEGVTHFNGAPTVLIMLINSSEAPQGRLAHPLRIATGGAPPSPTLPRSGSASGPRSPTSTASRRPTAPTPI